VSWGITGHLVPGGYKYGDLALRVGGVSSEKLIYDYGSCSALTSKCLHCKLQTRPLLREGVLYEKASNCQTKENLKSGGGLRKEVRHQDELADCPLIAKSTSNFGEEFGHGND
jgi:hypothetical protein